MKTDSHRRIPLLSGATLGVILLLAEVILILVSWLLSATMTEGVRSLLSGEGIRWFFGGFVDIIASPLLVWLLLILIALGSLQKSGLLAMQRSYREKVALRSALLLLAVYVVVILLLTVAPHAALLSVTGSLFPSAFSRSLVPVVAFGIVLVSISFGVMSGRIQSLAAVVEALSFGISKGAELFVLYILFMQFYKSLWFVFG
jgi:aminobenzoyl-glutamate transport protein